MDQLVLQDKSHKQIRVFAGGCFDIFHYGHANALRQAKGLGDVLVAGVTSDVNLNELKGLPVIDEENRRKVINAVKWVDEVVEVPFNTNLEVLDKNCCDFCVHGDDVSLTPDGKSSFYESENAGRFKIFTRTEGVSTTELIRRILLKKSTSEMQIGSNHQIETKLLMEFFSEKRKPKEGEKVVYVPGSYDLFHGGHVDFFQACLKFGSHILVGIHDNQVARFYTGECFPIMNMQERALGCLACKYVSDVVIGAPYVITEEFLDKYKIDFVVHGNTPITLSSDGVDPYEFCRKRNIFRRELGENKLTSYKIVEKVDSSRSLFEKRIQKKPSL